MKFIVSVTSAATLAAGLAAVPATVQAQSNTRGQVIVYGDDPCPRAADDEVVVCTRRPAEERYRIPEAYRPSGTRQQTQSWAAKSRALTTIGATGTESCSAVGPGGHTGCLVKQIDQAKQETEEAAATDAPPTK
ncbi:MAG: hypothetical protein ACJ8EY_09965 [Sphingomicrobium sp.]